MKVGLLDLLRHWDALVRSGHHGSTGVYRGHSWGSTRVGRGHRWSSPGVGIQSRLLYNLLWPNTVLGH